MTDPTPGRARVGPAATVCMVIWLAISLGGLRQQPQVEAAWLAVRQAEPRSLPSTACPKQASSAIAITSDGGTLLVVNPDSNSLTLVDATSRTVLAEIGVGVDPRTVAVDHAHGRAYVASRGDDRITVLDLAAQQVVRQAVVGNRPYGIVVDAAGERLYVAEQGMDRVAVLDAGTLETVAFYATADQPSGLALSPDGRTLYVTHLLTNTLTVLTVRPFVACLPLVGQAGSADSVGLYTSSEMGAVDSASARTPHFAGGLLSTIPLWPDSNLVQSIVIAPDGQRAYVPHTRSNTANRALTFDSTVFPVVSLIDLQARQHLVGQQFDLGTLDAPGVGLPFDAALTPDGRELWVVNAASNNVTVIDLASRRRAASIKTGDNPRGIVLSPDGREAYINNTLAGTVSVINTAAYTVTAVITVTEISLPPALLNGKRLFHSSDDPRLARARWISCNTCHFEGEHDGRTWFFGFAGPRNTTSLLGMIETYPLRWSGEWDESADAEFANRQENFGAGLISGEMNCLLNPPDCVFQPPNQGRSYDLDCLAAFMDSLQTPLSPAHTHGEPLSAAEQRGQALFNNPALGCAACHPPPLYTDQKMHDVGTATVDERIGPAYDTPSLRGLYGSAPYFHDGSAPTLYEALTRPSPNHEHDVRGLLMEAEIEDLIAFLLALPFQR